LERARSRVSVSFAQTAPAVYEVQGAGDQNCRHPGGGKLFLPRVVLPAEQNSVHTPVQECVAVAALSDGDRIVQERVVGQIRGQNDAAPEAFEEGKAKRDIRIQGVGQTDADSLCSALPEAACEGAGHILERGDRLPDALRCLR